MDHAINILQTALATATNNEPIQRSEGRIEEAEMNLARVEEISEALSHLLWIKSGWHKQPETFEGKIAAAINHHSLEAGSDTTDFILAAYLKRCLENFDLTMQHRATWLEPSDGGEDVVLITEDPTYHGSDIFNEQQELAHKMSEAMREKPVVVPPIKNPSGPDGWNHTGVGYRPEQKYRMLAVGETVTPGDEALASGKWIATTMGSWGAEVMDCGHREEAFRNVGFYRRPITEPEAPKYRMLEEGEILKEGDEVHNGTWGPTSYCSRGSFLLASNVGRFRRPL